MIIDPEIIRSENYPNAKPLTAEQKDALRKNYANLNCSRVEYDPSERVLVITSHVTLNNWQYYAGFEYIREDECTMLADRGELIAIFYDEVDRVDGICHILDNVTENANA